MTDYLLLLSELYWSITLYWSNSPALSLYGRGPKTENRHGDGPSRRPFVRRWRRYAPRLSTPDTYSADLDLSADAGLYPRHAAVVVQFTEMVVRKTSPALYRLLGHFSTTDYH